MKINAIRKESSGPNKTHFVIKHAYVSGTLYVDNEIADKYPDVKRLSFEIPMEIPMEGEEDGEDTE